MEKVNIILSPHFDDAVLSMGCFIVENSQNTFAVTVLGGAPRILQSNPWDISCGFTNSAEAVSERILENRAALKLLGLSNEKIVNLPYLDGQYRKSPYTESERVKMIGDIEKMITNNAIKEITVYAPMFNIHPDHLLVRDIFVSLYTKFADDPAKHFFLYQDFPYVDRFVTEQKGFPAIAMYIESELLQKVETKLFAYSAETFAEKKVAIAAYVSQVRQLSFEGKTVFELLDDFSKNQAAYLGSDSLYCEVFYQI